MWLIGLLPVLPLIIIIIIIIIIFINVIIIWMAFRFIYCMQISISGQEGERFIWQLNGILLLP